MKDYYITFTHRLFGTIGSERKEWKSGPVSAFSKDVALLMAGGMFRAELGCNVNAYIDKVNVVIKSRNGF